MMMLKLEKTNYVPLPLVTKAPRMPIL